MISEKNLTCDSKEFGVLASELLKAGYTIRFRAKGTSMHPMIRDGDVVFVAPLKAEQIHKGDVVFFIVGDERALLHRVVNIGNNSADQKYLIQGDGNSHPDGYISGANILGVMTTLERGEMLIPAEGFIYKNLGKFASLYSRVNPKKVKFYGKLFQVLRRLPFVRKYLS